MIYRSNLTAPDLAPMFKHAASSVRGHSFGHDVISDWQDKAPDDPVFKIYRECGFWTHDEAAILYTIAKERPGSWLDIGAHTGWTTAHLAVAGCWVTAIEPMLPLLEWRQRFEKNIAALDESVRGDPRYLFFQTIGLGAMRSDEYFTLVPPSPFFTGVVIDGDHNYPRPFGDALGAVNRLKQDGVILFHDAMGGPVWQGIYALIERGFKCHMYLTPHMVACCYRPEFQLSGWTPPVHEPDPAIDWGEIQRNHMREFQWELVSWDAYGAKGAPE